MLELLEKRNFLESEEGRIRKASPSQLSSSISFSRKEQQEKNPASEFLICYSPEFQLPLTNALRIFGKGKKHYAGVYRFCCRLYFVCLCHSIG